MFRLLFRQFHTIQIKGSNLFFPVSRVTLEPKDEVLWDHEVLKKKEKYQIVDLAHSNAFIEARNQVR